MTRGVRTTAASKILDDYIAPYDCTAVARMEAAGAVVLGKLNCDEFAMGSSNENSGYQAGAQSARSDAGPRRFFGRFGGGGSGRHGRGGTGLRYRRLDTAAGGLLRSGRADADLWPRFALRADRLRLVARSHRAADKDGEGCGQCVCR